MLTGCNEIKISRCGRTLIVQFLMSCVKLKKEKINKDLTESAVAVLLSNDVTLTATTCAKKAVGVF